MGPSHELRGPPQASPLTEPRRNGAPAVVYSFEVGGNYAPTFVSDNIKRVLGYEPDQYLKDPEFWRSRVHPEDLPGVEAA